MVQARCYMCGEKDITRFSKDKSRSVGVASRCMSCVRKESRTKLLFRRIFLNHLKQRGCAVCAETDVSVLEFHHVDPKLRVFNIAGTGTRTGWGRYFDEISKCILLCANCHKRSHFYRWNLGQYETFDRTEVEVVFDSLWSSWKDDWKTIIKRESP